MEDSLRNYVFITVGTTLFDDLVKAVDNPKLHKLLQTQGYKGIIIQIGVTEYKPKHALNLDDSEATTADTNEFYAFYFKQRPSIEKFLKNSDLVISHAGAGSITETLEKQKPIVVVVNDKLMSNHQKELADRLFGYVLPSTPSTLTHVIETDLPDYKNTHTLYQQLDSSNFAEYLSSKFGAKPKAKKGNSQVERKTVKTMAVLGSGGHTAEMFVELRNIDKTLFTPRLYVMADTDVRSRDKVKQFEKKVPTTNYSEHEIPRSRRVGQSYITSIWTTLVSFLYCVRLIFKSKPDLIICNGPGTCVPIVMAAILLRTFKITQTKVLFIESLARVQHLSLSGKILQYFVDWFVIQWGSLEGEVTKRAEVHVQNFYFPLNY